MVRHARCGGVQVMPNITIDKLETFVAALIESRACAAVAATTDLAATARRTEATLDS